MVAHPLAALAQNPEQHRVALWVGLEPALAVRLHTIRNVPTAPLALLSTVAVALIGALAGLIALPLGQHALDTALELAILRRLLLRLTAVDYLKKTISQKDVKTTERRTNGRDKNRSCGRRG